MTKKNESKSKPTIFVDPFPFNGNPLDEIFERLKDILDKKK